MWDIYLFSIWDRDITLYILEYDYDKLCWYDIFHVFKENEFLKENEFQRKMRYDYMWYVKSL
jgi:hypothetical protein